MRSPNRFLVAGLCVLSAALVVGCSAPAASAPGWTYPGSASAGIAPAPSPLEARDLNAVQLRAELDDVHAGRVPPHDVVTFIGIDTTRAPAPIDRECDPVGHCHLIGTLDGFPDPDGVVAVREAFGHVPSPTTAADLQPPVALHLSAGGPIEFLGGVTGGEPTLTWPVGRLLPKTDARNGEVFAVDGWLVGIGIGWSCGPAPIPLQPPVPVPFDCGVHDFLTPTPETPVTAIPSGRKAETPADALVVQRGAYNLHAADPANDGLNDVPRHGVYLVRYVTYDAVNCQACHGWEVIGRIAPVPLPPSGATPGSTASVPTVASPAELEVTLGAGRAPLVGRIVLVDGSVTRRADLACPTARECAIGTLAGTSEAVSADSYTAAMLLRDPQFGTTDEVMAFRVRQADLQYLGYMGYASDNTFRFPVASLADPQTLNHAPLMLAFTDAWLVDESPAYPVPLPAATPPADTPFDYPRAYLTPEPFQPTTRTPSGWSYARPPVGITVQGNAYRDFASDPAGDPSGVGDVPRFGTWLVRLVQDPREAGYTSGWQVLARLSP